MPLLSRRPLHMVRDDEIETKVETAVESPRETPERTRQLARVGELAMMCAHDLNNLLSILLLSIQQIEQEHAGDPRLAGELALLHTTAARAAQVNRELQLLGTRARPAPVAIALDEVLARLDRPLNLLAGVPVVITISASVVTRCDRALVEQALMNLVCNARDAMAGRGVVELELGVRAWPGGDDATGDHLVAGEYAAIAVADAGHGVPVELVRELFAPFTTSKERGKGSGLGLTIVREAVTAAGGGVTVEPRAGGGSVFTLLLPLVR